MTCDDSVDLDVFYIVTSICAILSLLGCMFILLIYAIAKELRVYAFKLVAYLAFCDIIKSLCIIIPSYKGELLHYLCSTQGFLLVSFSLSNLIWVLAISVSLVQVIVYKIQDIEKYHKYWLLLSFVFPLSICSLPFITNSYGNLYTWCTLQVGGPSKYWRYIIDFVPRWTSILLIISCYIKIYIHIKKNEFIDGDLNQRLFLRRMIAYPVIILIAFLPLTTLRFLQTNTEKCNYSFALVAYATFSIYGFFNAIAYGYNESISTYIKNLFSSRHRLSQSRHTDFFSTISDGVN
ncbi:hypothetical protein SteCoe_34074 [Stentor coeruleus]|uniref:G-protein coupled receptors family 2 profile 2 domain-containing protein n=1 Tax=Stentor coeruleus TaxID=5963 RepID=A0A1R2AVD5_9CILI|nr:hypothetical protein SteCoe_34074 [Stentor coeruleus]